MNYLDVYYRALIDYRKNTVPSRDCLSQRSATVKANAKEDRVRVVRKICTIETDWVEAIEKGLEHVDKAIREERQFIRSNGDVVDIEKVRSVSKDSVVHLAQHSNLITRYEEGEDVVPDKLYVVERLNDYAVYENRFLYMLLCYLRDFISVRYNAILDLEYTYNGSMSMTKKVDMPKRHLQLEIKLEEQRKDDPYLKARSQSKDAIYRVKTILELVHAFLSTPLMEEVAKVAMIKPPITKTNVLRMNHNFRGALALYEFVSSYDKPGYIVTEEAHNLQPFRLDMADEFSEIVLLSSFLTYEYGMNIKSELQLAFDAEEQRRAQEQKQRQREQIKAMRRRIEEMGESPEEYMLMLEKRNRLLEVDSDNLVLAKQEIEQLKGELLQTKQERDELKAEVERLQNRIEAMKKAHAEELERLHTEYKEKIRSLIEAYEQEKAELQQAMADMAESHRIAVAEMQEAHRLELGRINEEHRLTVERMAEEHRLTVERMTEEHRLTVERMTEEHRITVETMKADHRRTVAQMEEQYNSVMLQVVRGHERAMEDTVAAYKDRIESIRADWRERMLQMQEQDCEHTQRIRELTATSEQLSDALALSQARLLALRVEHGLITPVEDFTSREAFEELEHQREVFKRFFKKQWNKVKRAIRKDALDAYKDAVKEGTDEEYLAVLEEEAAKAKLQAQEENTEQLPVTTPEQLFSDDFINAEIELSDLVDDEPSVDPVTEQIADADLAVKELEQGANDDLNANDDEHEEIVPECEMAYEQEDDE